MFFSKITRPRQLDQTRPDCKVCRNKINKLYYNNNNEQIRAYRETYKPRNELTRERRAQDVEYRNKLKIRVRIAKALKSQNFSKSTKSMELVGCSKIWFKLWLSFT